MTIDTHGSFDSFAPDDAAIYDQDVVQEIARIASQTENEAERTDSLAHGTESESEGSIFDDVDLADIYIPRERTVYTFLVTSRSQFKIHPQPIAKYKWIGTDKGPYRMFGFAPVPKNIMPVGPASHLSPLDRLCNNLMNKQAAQAQRQKENPVYTPAGEPSANRLRTAMDGEWIQVNDPKEVNVIRQGGPDVGNQALLLNSIQLFDRMAGNLPALIGLGASSDTVGQERMIHTSASKKGAKMQKDILEVTTDIVMELLYLLWQDEFTSIPGEYHLEAYPQYSVRSDWEPHVREAKFEDYQITIDVHSITYQGPEERITKINSLLGQIYLPMAQLLAEQGGSIDFAKLTEIYSELLNLPRLREIVVFSNPIEDNVSAGGGGAGGGMPASTERRYIRQDSGGGTPAVPDASAWTGMTQQ
jgi:hypothetical protein